MDMKTLLDRTNDAINTIIRLDEATETGEFLKPCIEGTHLHDILLAIIVSYHWIWPSLALLFVAALHLGCTPRRATRSQRNVNPRCYLSQDSATNFDNIFMKPNSFSPKNLPVMTFHKDVVRSHREKCPVSVSSKYSTYPLCYSFQVPSLPISNSVTDSCKSKNRPASGLDAINGITFGGCDLSLRLGPLGDIRSPTQKRSKISSSSNNNNNYNSWIMWATLGFD